MEVTSFSDGVVGWCVDKNIFSTPLATWDKIEAPPGPRTIFLIHGLGGNRDGWTSGDDFANSLVGKLDDQRLPSVVRLDATKRERGG